MLKRLILILIILTGLSLNSCVGVSTEVEAPTTGDSAGLANPSAVYCEEQGYIYEIRSAADGSQSGVCIFPDGSECEGWAYFRGECQPGESHE